MHEHFYWRYTVYDIIFVVTKFFYILIILSYFAKNRLHWNIFGACFYSAVSSRRIYRPHIILIFPNCNHEKIKPWERTNLQYMCSTELNPLQHMLQKMTAL